MICPACKRDCGRLVEPKVADVPGKPDLCKIWTKTTIVDGVATAIHVLGTYVCDYCGEHWEAEK